MTSVIVVQGNSLSVVSMFRAGGGGVSISVPHLHYLYLVEYKWFWLFLESTFVWSLIDGSRSLAMLLSREWVCRGTFGVSFPVSGLHLIY